MNTPHLPLTCVFSSNGREFDGSTNNTKGLTRKDKFAEEIQKRVELGGLHDNNSGVGTT